MVTHNDANSGDALALFQHIFGEQQGYLFIGAIDHSTKKKELKSKYFVYPRDVRGAVEYAHTQAVAGKDVYFCAHLLKERRRVKENALPIRTLWADIDEGAIPEDKPQPTAVVFSSPGKEHAYLRLDSELPPEEAEELTRRIAYNTTADVSGWDLTQLLRVPGTRNYKPEYPDTPEVYLKNLTDTSYSAQELLDAFPAPSPNGKVRDAEFDASEPPVNLNPAQMKWWTGETYKGNAAGEIDRSATLLMIGRVLYDAGANRKVIVEALAERDMALGYEKYTDRRDEEKQYHNIVDELEEEGRNQPTWIHSNKKKSEDPETPEEHYRTDYGNGRRFAARYKGRAIYVSKWKRWLVWDGKRWREDTGDKVRRMAHTTAIGIFDEAKRASTTDEQKALASWAIQSQSRPRIEAMLFSAAPYLAVEHTELDRDPWLLNVFNGTVDLRSGDIREHDPEDFITKIAPVQYDATAPAPTFESFLSKVLPEEDVRVFLQRLLGYSLTGYTSEQVLPFLYGLGANGKSTLINAVLAAVGEYGMQAAPDLLIAKHGAHPTELADLFGARFVASVEIEDGRRLAESLVKQLTGGDKIRARRMHEDFWEFDPTHTVFLSANHKPVVRGTDHAIWRRIKLIPFTVQIPQKEQDKKLPEKLKGELPGILAWLVSGCLAWQRHGLEEPEEVTSATSEYRSEMDTLGDFLEERCVTGLNAEATSKELWSEWQDWAEETGEKAGSRQAFGRKLAERGFVSFKYTAGPNKDRTGWCGVGLKSSAPDPNDGKKKRENHTKTR
jgi:P4 family phage/plasmid primase-like protien